MVGQVACLRSVLLVFFTRVAVVVVVNMQLDRSRQRLGKALILSLMWLEQLSSEAPRS